MTLRIFRLRVRTDLTYRERMVARGAEADELLAKLRQAAIEVSQAKR